jgi:hypothetical protein
VSNAVIIPDRRDTGATVELDALIGRTGILPVLKINNTHILFT